MTIMRNSALAFAPQALAIVTGIVSSVITARYLGPDGRGVLSIILLTLAVLALIADLGLGSAITYFVSKGRLEAKRALAFCVYSAIVPGAIVAVIAMLLWPIVSSNVLQGVSMSTFLVSLAALPAMLFVNLRTRMEMALRRFSTTMIFQSIHTLGLLVVTAGVLLVARLGVHDLVLAMVAIWALSAFVMAAESLIHHGFDARIPAGLLSEIRSYALRAYAGGLVHYSTLRFDSFVLNAYAGNAAVGQYSMAVTLTEKIWLVDSSVGQATMPEVISRERAKAADLLAATCRTVVLVTVILGGTLALLAPWIIGFLYGEAFLPAVVPLRILAPGAVLFSASRIIGQYYSGQLGRPGVTSTVSGIVAAISLALYFALVPPFGFVGAAIASSIAYATGFSINAVLFYRATGIGVQRVLIPTGEEARRVLGMLRAMRDGLTRWRR